jgi:hypothetical protein
VKAQCLLHSVNNMMQFEAFSVADFDLITA